MRRRFLVPTVTTAIALVVGGCASTAERVADQSVPTTRPGQARPSGQVLVLASRAGTVSVSTGTGAVAFRAPNGVAAPDSSMVVQAEPIDTGTRVAASDAATGIPRWTHDVDGTRSVRVVAPGGRFVALVDGGLSTASSPRAQTIVNVVTPEGAREMRLKGNLDPEAFSVDGRYLYVLDFLPALNPTRYSVRRVDLRTLHIESVPDRDGGVRDPMPGYARTQLMSPDGKQLYTFYASPEPAHDGDETYNAWVHVLNLDKGWAHCVDLDEKIGVGGNANPALAVSPDGSRLFLTDGTTGAVAAVDTKTLRVLRTRFLPPLANAEQVSLLATDGHTVFARSGYGGLATIDASTLALAKPLLRAAAMSALRVDGPQQTLYLLTESELLVLDTRGRILRHWANPGDATSIDPSVTVPGRGAYQCAC